MPPSFVLRKPPPRHPSVQSRSLPPRRDGRRLKPLREALLAAAALATARCHQRQTDRATSILCDKTLPVGAPPANPQAARRAGNLCGASFAPVRTSRTQATQTSGATHRRLFLRQHASDHERRHKRTSLNLSRRNQVSSTTMCCLLTRLVKNEKNMRGIKRRHANVPRRTLKYPSKRWIAAGGLELLVTATLPLMLQHCDTLVPACMPATCAPRLSAPASRKCECWALCRPHLRP